MWSHNFVATSSGPGIADLPWVAVRPISLAYSGDMVATEPVPRVAMCQMPIKARNSAIETIAARKRSEEVMAYDPSASDEFARPRSRRLPDLETIEIVFRSSRVEGLAHHHKALAGRSRRRQAGLGHQLGGVGGEIDVRSDARIVDLALDLTPALHLRHDPDRKRLPRERIEIDAVRLGHDIAQPVRERAGENLLQHDLRLVQVIRRRDRFRNLLAVLGLVREGGGLDDRFEQRGIGIRHRRDEFLRGGEGAAWVPLPDILGQDVDEADAVIDRALVHRIGTQ